MLYDALVFSSQSRFPTNLAQRLQSLLSGECDEKIRRWSWCVAGESQHQPRLRKWMVALFLMEDLLVRLQELKIPGLKQKGKGLETWLSEVHKMDLL